MPVYQPFHEDHDDPSNDVDCDSSSGPGSSGIDKGKGKANTRMVKKRKLNRACDSCRRRKVRCDFVQLPSGDLDKCLNCFSAKTECTFSEEAKPRTSTKRDVRDLEEKVRQAEELLAQVCPDPVIREALLDRTTGLTSATLANDGEPSGVVTALPSTADERAHAFLEQVSASLRASMLRFTTPASPEVTVELPGEQDVFPRLVPYNWHQDTTPSLFMGESADPQLVIRALRMKEVWQTEGRSRLTSPACSADGVGGERDDEELYLTPERLERRDFLSERRPVYWNTPWWEHSSPAILKSNQCLHKYRFPEPALMESLLHLYFEHYNVLMPLIHRPTLERELGEGLHRQNEAFATTVILMCALGARYSDDPEVLLGEEDVERSLNTLRSSQATSASPKDKADLEKEIDRLRKQWGVSLKHSRGWKYFEQTWDARGSLAVIVSPTIYDVQASILSVSFMRFTSFPPIAWTALGVGLRLLQDIGGHRRIVDSSRGMTKAQEELLKRACWVMVTFDRMLSMATGRPCALREEELDMDLPTECDDEYWDHPDPQQRWKQPSHRPSAISAFVANIRLLEILGMVLGTIYGTKQYLIRLWNVDKNVLDKRVITEVESALNTWLGSLPPHLVWDPNQSHVPFLIQSAWLHTMFYYIQILIHRPFIPTPRRPADLGFPSLLICTNAARAILSVCCTLLDRGCDIPGETMLSIFSSGTVLLLKAWHTRQSRGSDRQFKKDMDEVHKSMRILRAMEGRAFLTGRLWDLLNGLASGESSMHSRGASTAGSTVQGTGQNANQLSSVSNSSHSQPLSLHSDPSVPFSVDISPGDPKTPVATHWAPGCLSSASSSGPWHHDSTSLSSRPWPADANQRPLLSPSAPLAGSGSMFGAEQLNPFTFNPGADGEIFQQPWPSMDATSDPLSVAADMASLWDWGLPRQGDDPVSYNALDELMGWSPQQSSGSSQGS